ncbi:hypothetical protein [Acidicapsa acidisoli]|uniref:hypothetical protein n=1 Tax=Acidicapsa acidisoli TaxID=1615681 RepID=UPI0021E0CF3C|nr:hypothetical protein [Acidicapsa acidisoli]
MNSMNQQDNLDKILLTQDTLLPSSGFAQSVLDAIQQESAAPAPLPFPWKFALPGLALLFIACVAGLWFLYTALRTTSLPSSIAIDLPAWLPSNAVNATLLRTQAVPALLAIAGSWGCVWLCRRLTGMRSAR